MSISRRAITLILIILILLGVFFLMLSGRITKNSSDQSASVTPSKTAVKKSASSAISAIKQLHITPTSATITWTTSVAATSQIFYGPESLPKFSTASVSSEEEPQTATVTTSPVALPEAVYPSKTEEDKTLLKSHTIVLSDLQAGTEVFYRIISRDEKGKIILSDEKSFKTATASKTTVSNNRTGTVSRSTVVKPLAIAGIKQTSVSSTSSTISWTTTIPSSSQVMYGTESSTNNEYPNKTIKNFSLVSNHSVTLSNLTPNTKIYYRVVSTDASGKTVTSATESSFTVATVAITVIKATIGVSSLMTSSVTITWTTNLPSTSQVIFDSETQPTGNYASKTPIDYSLVTSHKVIISNLAPNTKIYYRVLSTDSAGTKGISLTESTFTTPMIFNVISKNISSSKATITWKTSVESNSQVIYGPISSSSGIYPLSTEKIANETLSHTVNIFGLDSNTTFYYRVVSVKADGKKETSNEFSFTTTN